MSINKNDGLEHQLRFFDFLDVSMYGSKNEDFPLIRHRIQIESLEKCCPQRPTNMIAMEPKSQSQQYTTRPLK